MRKILFCDIDGTLVHGDSLYSLRDWEALGRMRKAGHLIVYCTARNRREAYSVIQRFHLPYDYLILNNGSQIEDRAGLELYNHPLSHDLGMEILRFCRNYLGYYLYFQGSGEKTDCGIRNELADCVSSETEERGEKAFWEAAKRAEAYNMIGIKPYGKNAKLSKLVGIAGDIRQRYGAEVKVSLNTLSLAVTAKAQTKATAMVKFLSFMGQPLKVYCIGDSCNDTCMFCQADRSFAFFRSQQWVRASADALVGYVCEAVDQILDFPA